MIIDGDAKRCAAQATDLVRQGHDVTQVRSGLEAVLVCSDCDVVILSLDLPDVDGLYVCREIAEYDVPIIVTAERKSELDCVLALQAGADDYLAQPYHFRELAARVDALVWRWSTREPPQASGAEPVVLRIDVSAREVTVFDRGVELTRKEFDLLVLLAENVGRVVPRDQIMRTVWGHTWSRRTADTHISSLRSKLGTGSWIIAVRGVGFKLVCDAEIRGSVGPIAGTG
ncbi:response regulator transcription factor [Nocardia halotolerans]|uniref:Response regulator transcription factor n=1 Tax=Nocardia halotolerans TaxID=1755878 RepID=A0ABV8VK87_9NOCA